MVAIILSWCWLGPQHNFIYTVAKAIAIGSFVFLQVLQFSVSGLLIKSVKRGAEVW